VGSHRVRAVCYCVPVSGKANVTPLFPQERKSGFEANNVTGIRISEVEKLSAEVLVSDESRASATPMMEQYIEIKANNPDSLLFYRMGDFYELFFQDAEEASRALGITLTKRGQHMGVDIPMCGVPVHAADDYLQKLIAKGFRVAVCEQVEDPAEAKKRGSKSVVRRDVVRLVTPGTLTEEKLLSPSESNYLMALARIRGAGGEMALAWIDISTGVFRLAETDASRLLADILRIDPRELILPDTLFHDPELRSVFDVLGKVAVPQPTVLFDSATAEGRIARYFGVKTLDGFGGFSRAEMAAAAAAVAYVEKTQISERPALGIPEREAAASTLFIDPATRANLELAKTLSGDRNGSLLKAIDRTVTGGGARMIAERLMSPLTDPDAINRRLDSISYLLGRQALTDDIRMALKHVPDMPRALSRLALDRGGPRDLGAVRQGIEAARTIAMRLSADLPLTDELSAALEGLKALPEALEAMLGARLADELPLLKRDGGFLRPGANAELDEVRALRDESRRVIAGLQLQYAEETGIKSLKIKHNNVLGYFIEVTAGNSGTMTGTDEAKGRFIHRQTMASAMRFTTTELSDLESRIANAAGRALEIELEAFEAMKAAVVSEAEAIKAGARALSVLDVAAALAVLAEEQGYCRPHVDGSKDFAIVAGRHPVVEQALRRQSEHPFVANNCDLSPEGDGEFGAIWLLTGPNMGGKSTFLRQNALIAIMAQMGSFVPAGSASIGVVDRLFSRVGASDDLARGRSTFMVEMVETAAILNQATDRSLVILDEIGRGTATFDGLSIAWAAVEHLHEVNRCRGLFATHFHELTVLSEKLGRLSNATMRVKEWDGDVIFLHEVGPGAADRSYGIQVARLAGLPAAVVSRAREVLTMLEDADRKNPAHQLIDDLPLFQVAVRRDETAKAKTSAVEEALKAINPDDMTPRDALDALYALKKRLGNP
jgi:DNA mismatch repair protein MutS